MKTLFENWRKFYNEEQESAGLSDSTLRLLPMLINLKKFKSPSDFLQRTEIYTATEGGDEFQLTAKVDGQVAGNVTYWRFEDEDNCRPKPFSNKPTYMLTTVARDASFKGFGIGRLISFLSVCYINNEGGSITSDRDTSDLAGGNLVNTLKMLGAKESEPFDYVGWFKSKLAKAIKKSEGNPEFPVSPSGPHAAQPDWDRDARVKGLPGTRSKANRKIRMGFGEKYLSKMQQLYNHLEPLTKGVSDDCQPSVNLMQGEESFATAIKGEEFLNIADKFMTMDNQQIQDFLNSDKRVQGYTFALPPIMIKAGVEIMTAIDKTKNVTDDELAKIRDQGHEVFGKTYDAEIGRHGQAKTEVSENIKIKRRRKNGTII